MSKIGKGVGAILNKPVGSSGISLKSDQEVFTESGIQLGGVVDLDMNDIGMSDQNERIYNRVNDPDIETLAKQINEEGILSPIIVKDIDGKSQIIAGHRRYLANKFLGKTTIPAQKIRSTLPPWKLLKLLISNNHSAKTVSFDQRRRSYMEYYPDFENRVQSESRGGDRANAPLVQLLPPDEGSISASRIASDLHIPFGTANKDLTKIRKSLNKQPEQVVGRVYAPKIQSFAEKTISAMEKYARDKGDIMLCLEEVNKLKAKLEKLAAE